MPKTSVLQLKKPTHCIICGKSLEETAWSSGYYFLEDETETISIYTCCSRQCVNEKAKYANPVFQNKRAMEFFAEKHPVIWKRIRKKPKLFLEKEA